MGTSWGVTLRHDSDSGMTLADAACGLEERCACKNDLYDLENVPKKSALYDKAKVTAESEVSDIIVAK